MKKFTFAAVMLATQITFAQVTQYETGPIKITPQIREALGTTRIQDGVRIEAMDLNQLRESLRNTKGRAVLHVGPGHEIELERESSGVSTNRGASAEAARPGVLVGSGGQGQDLPLVDLTDGKPPEESTRIMFVTDNWNDFKVREGKYVNGNLEWVQRPRIQVSSGEQLIYTLDSDRLLSSGVVSYLPSHLGSSVSVYASVVTGWNHSSREELLVPFQSVSLQAGALNVIPIRKVTVRYSEKFLVKGEGAAWILRHILNTNRQDQRAANLAVEPYTVDTFFFIPGKYEFISGPQDRQRSVKVEIK